jgi:phage gpG-like protein
LAKSRTLTQLAIDLKTEGSTKGLPARLRKLMAALAIQAEGFAKVNVSRKLKRRTGHLMGSIAGSALAAEQGMGIQLRAGGRTKGGGRVPYAGIHEFGGVIKGRPLLRIPLSAALTSAGVDRFPSPLRQTGAGLFALREIGGRLFLFRTDEEDGPPWYILKSSVKIPARPYLRPAMTKLQRKMPNELRQLVSVSIMGGV